MHEQRLLAEPVARKQQRARARVPERERVHAVERVDEVTAVLLVQMHENLGVRPRSEEMTLGGKPISQGPEVVDLAVEHAVNGVVFVAERLVAARDVDDAQSRGTDRDVPAAVRIQAGVVRPAVP